MADLKELVLGIAAAMPQYFVQGAEKFGTIGHQHDGAAALSSAFQILRNAWWSSVRCSTTFRQITVSKDSLAGNELASVASRPATHR